MYYNDLEYIYPSDEKKKTTKTKIDIHRILIHFFIILKSLQGIIFFFNR